MNLLPQINRFVVLFLLLVALVVVACNNEDAPGSGSIRGELVVDGETRTFVYNQVISVQEMLRRENVSLDPLDDVSPSLFTRISDGMTVTVVRVREDSDCNDEVLPFEEHQLRRTDLEPGETIIAEQGENGLVRICERVVYRDDVEASRSVQNQTVLQEPKDQVVYIGVNDTLEPVAIEGTLAYISGGQAWVIEGNSTTRQPVTLESDLDGRVFDLSPDGQLLFTRLTTNPDDPDFSNELWIIPNLNSGESKFLQQTDILTATWRPGAEDTVAYSTATPGGGFQGWTAFNDLWVMRVNPFSGEVLGIDALIEQNVSGTFAAWGTRFAWSSDGERLAYAKADGVGLVDFETGDFGDFRLTFPFFNAAIADNWVWQPTLSWSDNGRWVVTTVHGPPYSAETPEDSIIFNIAVFEVDPEDEEPTTITTFVEQAGIWANPQFSPELSNGNYRIAYLQARDPLNSVGTEYDLVVMDRDGSNRQVIFPADGSLGVRPVTLDGAFVWSPSGRQIAIVYQRDIWLVDVETGLTQQITNDGQASNPRWVQ